jgi:hypothetical protein
VSHDKQLHSLQDLYKAEVNTDTAQTGSITCPIRFRVAFVMAPTALEGTAPNLVQ